MTDKEIRLPESLDVEKADKVLREFASTDDAQIYSESRIDSLENELQEAKNVFAALLAEDSPMSADALARNDMDALTEPFRDDEGEIEVDTLRQTTETGDTDADTDGVDNGDGSDGFDLDTLDSSTREQIRDVDLVKIHSFETRGMDAHVDTLKADVAEKCGAESFEDIEAELEAL